MTHKQITDSTLDDFLNTLMDHPGETTMLFLSLVILTVVCVWAWMDWKIELAEREALDERYAAAAREKEIEQGWRDEHESLVRSGEQKAIESKLPIDN